MLVGLGQECVEELMLCQYSVRKFLQHRAYVETQYNWRLMLDMKDGDSDQLPPEPDVTPLPEDVIPELEEMASSKRLRRPTRRHGTLRQGRASRAAARASGSQADTAPEAEPSSPLPRLRYRRASTLGAMTLAPMAGAQATASRSPSPSTSGSAAGGDKNTCARRASTRPFNRRCSTLPAMAVNSCAPVVEEATEIGEEPSEGRQESARKPRRTLGRARTMGVANQQEAGFPSLSSPQAPTSPSRRLSPSALQTRRSPDAAQQPPRSNTDAAASGSAG